jgi:nickel superoxide dismutase
MAVIFSLLIVLPNIAVTHCQIPCGIYDDMMRINMLNEHITTIEKSMNMITELSAEGEKNYNQIVRWVMNKENHADQFMEIVTAYFMAQRIKPVAMENEEAYVVYQQQIELLHQMLVYAMKCKQTTDEANVKMLTELVNKFKVSYFPEDEMMHEH